MVVKRRYRIFLSMFIKIQKSHLTFASIISNYVEVYATIDSGGNVADFFPTRLSLLKFDEFALNATQVHSSENITNKK